MKMTISKMLVKYTITYILVIFDLQLFLMV
jgi:hypothetical protein